MSMTPDVFVSHCQVPWVDKVFCWAYFDVGCCVEEHIFIDFGIEFTQAVRLKLGLNDECYPHE